MEHNYVYRNRAVAFLDVLGFRQKLNEFENEAKHNNHESITENTSDSGDIIKYVSTKANDFINTFKGAIGQLDGNKYTYYLFSDNICITSIRETTPEDLQDLLLVISRLYYEFAQKGYFLRGGIDYGLFIDEETIAVGTPLAIAYELETKKAVYPRIILSQNLVNEFQEFNLKGEKEYEYFYADALIKDSCEIKFLNVFLQVFQSDYRQDRENFFSNFNKVIIQNLEANKSNETVFVKYKWLAEQFNEFIDSFTSNLAFMDVNFDPESEPGFLDSIKQQKISYAN